ncbi:MAG TPA: prolyl oligopeptidase family serine peptidase [Bryobacteraceae bacterium]|jgi:dipeptidyl aminopeptidase/acylaminoacyl peptidase|nr:prolyl oligopeptidase family serine peptidase [Bryobacteraceae bacterium]
MKHCRLLALFVFAAAVSSADTAQRPIQLNDILAWKRIVSQSVSPDGIWFAYRVSPAEGNSEVVIRNLKDGKEQHFPIGEIPRVDPPAGGPPAPMAAARDLALSDDGKWAAFLAYPTAKEAKVLKKAKKPIQSRVIVVELATGKKTEFEKVRRFAFSGERSTMLAMHRYAPTPAGPPAAPPAPGAPADDKPTGSDLILYEMATGNEMNVGNVSDFSFDKKGNYLAWLIDAQDKIGNGVEVRDMAAGTVMPLDNAKASYKGLSWTENGDGLATMRGVEDKGWEDKLYTVVAFSKASNGGFQKVVFDPSKETSFPKGMSVSPNRNAMWMADLSEVTFGIHELRPKKKGADAKTEEADAKPKTDDTPDLPDMVIWHYKDSRLQPMQQVQESMDKNFSFLCAYRPSEQKFLRLGDDDVRVVTLTPESKYAYGTDIRNYELDSHLSGQAYEDVYAIDLKTGARKLAVKKARYVMGASPDGSHILYYGEGVYYTYEAATGQTYNITKQIPATFWDTEDDHNVVKPPHRPIGWAKDSSAVLLTDGWDIWKAPAHGGAGLNLTVNGKKDKIRYRSRYRLDPDEKGIDLAQPIYVNSYGEWTKKAGVAVIAPGATAQSLVFDDASYGTLMKAKRANVFLYTRETVSEYPDYHVAVNGGPGPKITDANPQQKDFLWSKGSRLIEYTSDKGDKLQGTLYLPANYEQGKSYPTITYIYEKLSQSTNMYPHPTYNGFNIAAYTSNGYAVLTPDIVYKVNDPGMSAVWCVLPAVKAAIATGVVDAKRVGIHGHSWGGYQTAFLVTQTNMFAAAIAGAPLTDMIAMYNAIYWNTGTANQPIFESSQGRFTGSPTENMEAYVRNSPVYHAKNVTTPLIILHNDKDGAVDWTQGIEYFNTLRRMGKPVVMLQYKGENHGLRKPENMKDYTVRMKEFFDYRLSDKEPPKWLIEGVPLLKMKDHIEERTKEITKAPVAVGAGAGSPEK